MKRTLTVTMEFEGSPVFDKDGNVISGTDEEYIRDILYTIESSVGEKITSVKLDGVEMQEKVKDRDAGRNDMTLEELAKYAKEVGVPDRVFKETFRPLFERENKVLNDYEALVAKAECDRQAEYWKEFKKFLDHNRAEREKKK